MVQKKIKGCNHISKCCIIYYQLLLVLIQFAGFDSVSGFFQGQPCFFFSRIGPGSGFFSQGSDLDPIFLKNQISTWIPDRNSAHRIRKFETLMQKSATKNRNSAKQFSFICAETGFRQQGSRSLVSDKQYVYPRQKLADPRTTHTHTHKH